MKIRHFLIIYTSFLSLFSFFSIHCSFPSLYQKPISHVAHCVLSGEYYLWRPEPDVHIFLHNPRQLRLWREPETPRIKNHLKRAVTRALLQELIFDPHYTPWFDMQDEDQTYHQHCEQYNYHQNPGGNGNYHRIYEYQEVFEEPGKKIIQGYVYLQYHQPNKEPIYALLEGEPVPVTLVGLDGEDCEMPVMDVNCLLTYHITIHDPDPQKDPKKPPQGGRPHPADVRKRRIDNAHHNMLPPGLRFTIQPHKKHPAEERQDRIDREEQQATLELLYALQMHPNLNSIFENFMANVEKLCLRGCCDAGRILEIEREEALEQLLSLQWPENLPRGSIPERAFYDLKDEIRRSEYHGDGTPRTIKNNKDYQKRARKRSQALFNYIRASCMPQAAKEIIESLRFSVPYFDVLYNKAYNTSGFVKGVKATGRLLQNMVTGPFDLACDLWQGDLPKNIRENQIAQDYKHRREHYKKGEFDKASHIGDAYLNTPHYHGMVKPIKEAFFETHTPEGAPKCCVDDPLWQNLPASKKREFQSFIPNNDHERFRFHESKELNDIREKLLERHAIKTELMRGLGIPEHPDPSVNKMLYNLVDCCQDGIINYPALVQQVAHLNQDDSSYNYFYKDNGVCKLLPHDPTLLQGLSFDKRINSDTYNETRQVLNGFLSVDTSSPEAKDFVRKGLELCEKASNSNEMPEVYQKLAKSWFASGVGDNNDQTLLNLKDFPPPINPTQQGSLEIISNVAEQMHKPTRNPDELKVLLACGQAMRDLASKKNNVNARYLEHSDYLNNFASKNNVHFDIRTPPPFRDDERRQLDKRLEEYIQDVIRRSNDTPFDDIVEDISNIVNDTEKLIDAERLAEFQAVEDGFTPTLFDHMVFNFGAGCINGFCNAWQDILEMAYHPVETIKTGRDFLMNCNHVMAYYDILTDYFELGLTTGNFEPYDRAYRGDPAYMPEVCFNAKKKLDNFCGEAKECVHEFIKNVSAEDWAYVSGQIVGTSYGWHYHPFKVAKCTSDVSGLTGKANQILSECEKSFINGRLGKKIITIFEESDYKRLNNIARALRLRSLTADGNPFVIEIVLSRELTARLDFSENGIRNAIEVMEANNIPIDSYLHQIGDGFGYYGLPPGVTTDLAMEQLIRGGLNQEQLNAVLNYTKEAFAKKARDAASRVPKLPAQDARNVRAAVQEIKDALSQGRSLTSALEQIGESIGKYGIESGTIFEYLHELRGEMSLTSEHIKIVIDNALENLSPISSELGEVKYMLGSSGYEHIVRQGKITDNICHVLEIEFNLPGNSLMLLSTDPFQRIDEVKRIRNIADVIVKGCNNKEYKKIVRDAFNDYIEYLKRPICNQHGEPILKKMHQYVPPGLLEKLPSKFELEKLGAQYSRVQLPGKINGQDILAQIDLEHIFLTNIEIDCARGRMRMGGFHHDYLGTIEQSGILDIKQGESLSNGIYKINWGYGLGDKPSTMFPKNWTREQVMEKSLEALRHIRIQDFAKENNNRYLVEGVTSDGITILWVFEAQNEKITGDVISIYPLIK